MRISLWTLKQQVGILSSCGHLVMAVLLKPVKEGRPIAIDKPIVLIGRHPGCDVILQRSRKVSRKHCCLARSGDRFLIRDLGSRNGVWVNGKRILEETEIRIGDEISIGDVVYRLENAQDKSPARPKRKRSARGNEAEPEREKRRSPEGLLPPDLSQDFPIPIPEEDGRSEFE